MNPTEPRPEGDGKPPPPELELVLLTSKDEEPPLVEAVGPAAVPTQPRPGFGAGVALLWCLLFLLVSQLLPAAGLFVYLILSRSPEAIAAQKGVELSPGELQAAMLAAPLLGLTCAVTVLRWKAGRGWPRKIAM